MEMFLTIFSTAVVYLLYQFERNAAVYNIRRKWNYENDERWYTYSYKYMYIPKLSNWFGIRFPKDKHFKP